MASSSSSSSVVVMILIGLVVVVIIGFVLYLILSAWAERAYERYKQEGQSHCDIDSFCKTDPPNKLKVCVAHFIRMQGRQPRLVPIPLECIKSPHVEGLYVSRNVQRNAHDSPIPLTELLPRMTQDGTIDPQSPQKTIVVATIRMGFGHHRLAYSACSWALEQGYTTIFHDLLNVESPESQLIQTLDALYSKCSRWASEFGGPIEKLWGQAMTTGDATKLQLAALTAAHLQPLLLSYPKDIPLITTHQTVALVAAAAGFTNVINLVVDNYPQWFLVVPKTVNVVQGPVNYQSFLTMGVPSSQLKLAGHWCPATLVQNLPKDCQTRMARLQQPPQQQQGGGNSTTTTKPLRLVIPVGGAGAQKTFIVQFVQAISDWITQGKLQVFLNAGDHDHMKRAFQETLEKCALEYDMVTTTKGVLDFQQALLQGQEPTKAVTLFAFTDYFPAVATTDLLCRVADVLVCKPSELAFYPIPKLHIRRVGDHEADSARRSAEIGDGSCEARDISSAMRYLKLFLEPNSPLLMQMNQSILSNHQSMGIYNGCQNAVTWAMMESPKTNET